MRRTAAALVLGLVAASRLPAQIPLPADAPLPRSPRESAAAFVLPDGFRMELVASEPLISAPSGICWDERGRMFVTELHGYNLEGQLEIEELNRTGRLDTQVRRVTAAEKFKQAAKAGTYGVVKLLRDTDGDGVMDDADIWARDLPPAHGLVPARGGVIVACTPDIVFLADRDGDGQAEVREVLFTGFRPGELERGINAPLWGDDGWIYFGRGWSGGVITGPRLARPATLDDSDFRIRPDGSAIEPVTGGTHTFGFAFTESGDRFVVSPAMPAYFIAPLPWRYLARNPAAAVTGVQFAAGDRRAYGLAPPHPWRRRRADDPAYAKFYRDRYGAAESDASGWFTGACGSFVYRDHALPGLHGQYLVCEPAGSFIHRARIESEGPALRLHRVPGEEKAEFAASVDPWSHPIFLAHAPDGTIGVVDYYREIIEDYSAIPRHLQQQYGLAAGRERGRIYRLTHRGVPPAPAADLSRADDDALVREAASLLLWRRQTAQRLLAERRAAHVAPALRATLSAGGAAPGAVITALHALDGLGALLAKDVRPLLRHEAVAVRVHAFQLGDRWLKGAETNSAMLEALLSAHRAETDPRVQLQIALSLGESREPAALTALAGLARTRLDVRWMEPAVLSSVSGRGPDLLAELVREPGDSGALLGPLARAIGASRDEAGLLRTLKLMNDVPPASQAVVLQGLTRGRAYAVRRPTAEAATKATLETLAHSEHTTVRAAAVALQETFAPPPRVTTEEPTVDAASPETEVSEEKFKRFVAALDRPRDTHRGGQVFRQHCIACHRLGGEGLDFGPDLIGEIGGAEETMVRHLLLPAERIRPGFETTEIVTTGGDRLLGLLKTESATALTLSLPGGIEQVVLRQDAAQIRRVTRSLMPSFADILTPAESANLIAWLRGQLDAVKPP
jgi:putative membrane-bound dehydrogenase-like protein